MFADAGRSQQPSDLKMHKLGLPLNVERLFESVHNVQAGVLLR